jgi:putative NIF3 family GTP cyclohydrolase 1 type 2
MNNKLLHGIFDPGLLDSHPDEWGIVIHCPDPQSIGFATTLTPAVIRQAIAKDIKLLVTHHDAWDFMLEERQTCTELLAEHQISHVWCHAPLDAAEFGTSAALLSLTGCRMVEIIANGDGRIGELPRSMHLSDIRELVDGQLSEIPCRVHDANRLVTRIACVTGAGAMTKYLAEALAYGVDLYLTGETSLYLLEYASFHNVNVLIYSHNYTEIFGTQNLARKIADQLGIREIFQLDEPHY